MIQEEMDTLPPTTYSLLPSYPCSQFGRQELPRKPRSDTTLSLERISTNWRAHGGIVNSDHGPVGENERAAAPATGSRCGVDDFGAGRVADGAARHKWLDLPAAAQLPR